MQDLDSRTRRRLQIVAKDVSPLLAYGRRLTSLAEALEPGVGEAWRAYRFTDLSWVPKRVRVCLEGADGWVDTAAKIKAVAEREQQALQRAVAKRKNTCTETIDLMLRLRADAPALLAGDTWELGRTRFLPPTASLPDSQGDLEAFLAPAALAFAPAGLGAARSPVPPRAGLPAGLGELAVARSPVPPRALRELAVADQQVVVPGPVHAGEAQAGGAHVE